MSKLVSLFLFFLTVQTNYDGALVMYQSIPSLTIPRGTPRDLHVLTSSGVGFSPNFLCQGGRGLELEKFPTVLNEKSRKFSICFKETGAV